LKEEENIKILINEFEKSIDANQEKLRLKNESKLKKQLDQIKSISIDSG
jgi:hypothetical protein